MHETFNDLMLYKDVSELTNLCFKDNNVCCITFEDFNARLQNTRSSATAEKQRVSCPHGGGLGPPAQTPSPSGYTYA